MKKVFVTGGDGFIGSHVSKRLDSCKVYQYKRGDSLDGIIDFDPDTILHIAGEVYNELEMVDSNVVLTYNLLQKAKQLKNLKSLVYVGSSSEYGRKQQPMREYHLLEPTTIYEATKGAGTLLVQAYAHEFGVPAMIARPFSVYGANEPDFRFIPKAIKFCCLGQEFTIAPGVHDWIHVDDFIDGVLMLADNPQPGEIYNFGTAVQTENSQVLDIIEKHVGKPIKRVLVEKMKSYDSICWVADNGKARTMGWEPNYDLDKGLAQVISIDRRKYELA